MECLIFNLKEMAAPVIEIEGTPDEPLIHHVLDVPKRGAQRQLGCCAGAGNRDGGAVQSGQREIKKNVPDRI